MWDQVFGKANNIFSKMAKMFVTTMVNAMMQVAAKMATLWVLKLIFPAMGATGVFEKILGMHQGGQIPNCVEGRQASAGYLDL